jgi:hypothetical protein
MIHSNAKKLDKTSFVDQNLVVLLQILMLHDYVLRNHDLKIKAYQQEENTCIFVV